MLLTVLVRCPFYSYPQLREEGSPWTSSPGSGTKLGKGGGYTDCVPICFLGMLALEMLGRRAHNDHPNNFSRSPPYTDDVKWLLGLAAKLGNTSPPQDHCPRPDPTFLPQTSFLALAQS